MASDLSKEEYLKRYLEDNDKDKKRKKRVKTAKTTILPRIKIVNQDIDIKSIKFGTKDEVEVDEAPIIAEVVDDRPIEVKAKEIYAPSKWKKFGEDDSETVSTEKDSASLPEISSQSNESRKSSSTDKLQKSNTKRRHDSDNDLPSVRVGGRHDSDSDMSPPRRRVSVKEKENTKNHSSNSFRKNSSPKSRRNDSDSDLSPVRQNRKNSPHSNRKRYNSDSDLSPEREHQRKASHSKNANHNSDSDLSPPRKRDLSSGRGKPLKEENYRPTKTLSGMKAGLQNAATLRKEIKEFRKRETAQIRELDDELSGRNASTIVRDRRTGKRRDIEAEARVDEEKEKKLSETQQKYAKWGKGIEQTEIQKEKLSEDMYEMSKPLARHCDDEDLEERLKTIIHEDDPMAEYIRKKRRKDVSSVYPVYSGPPPPPNRFSIPPGYRWDGVDRSNGFEKKYFDLKSSKKASEEEAYLWSVQDM